MSIPPSMERWKRAEEFWAARQAEPARREYDALLSDPDWMLPANLRLGAIALETGQVRAAVSHALAAFYAREPDPPLLEALCRMLLNVGETRSARALACAAGYPQPFSRNRSASPASRAAPRGRAVSSTTIRVEWIEWQVCQSASSWATPRKNIAPGTFSST